MVNGDRVYFVIRGVGNENVCEISVENIDFESINVYNIFWFILFF